MSRKMIELSMPDGAIFHIPLRFVAEHRAKYYSERDGGTSEHIAANFIEEVAWVMEDEFEAIDWMQNSMKWEDLAPVAVRKSPATPPHYAEWFRNSHNKIVEESNLHTSPIEINEGNNEVTHRSVRFTDDRDEHMWIIFHIENNEQAHAMIALQSSKEYGLNLLTLPEIISELQRTQADLEAFNSRKS
ncbi:MAG: hypothetical protein ACPG7F_00350 [Aggregatilineales bacterium]